MELSNDYNIKLTEENEKQLDLAERAGLTWTGFDEDGMVFVGSDKDWDKYEELEAEQINNELINKQLKADKDLEHYNEVRAEQTYD